LFFEFEKKTIREVGLFAKIITILDQPTKGRKQPNLKSMYKFTKHSKRKVVIRNEIMIHFGFTNLITNNKTPYSNEAWKEKNLKHKLDKLFFSILDFELNE
jgi:hypothetical protein